MMSSTCTRFQAPQAVYTYGYPETEPQQPYSNHHFSSYSADYNLIYKSLLNDTVTSHTEDHYDPGCSYVSYGLEASQFEETDEAFGYGVMQNNSNASPQSHCPRPTRPTSQFSPHFPWYDWSSEAPANIYEAEQSPHTNSHGHGRLGLVGSHGINGNSTSFLPHLPQGGEIEHSFGNQLYMSPSKPFPAPQESAESVPISLAPSYLGDGCYSQPFIIASTPSFDQGPTQSTYVNIQTGFYYSAHQPVLPSQRSSYSELAPNLNFMNSQTPQSHNKPLHTQDFSKPKNDDVMAKGTISSLHIEKNPFALGFDGPPLTAFGRKVPLRNS